VDALGLTDGLTESDTEDDVDALGLAESDTEDDETTVNVNDPVEAYVWVVVPPPDVIVPPVAVNVPVV
jgi:hypothetical protein